MLSTNSSLMMLGVMNLENDMSNKRLRKLPGSSGGVAGNADGMPGAGAGGTGGGCTAA
jgi:hypothetical protein